MKARSLLILAAAAGTLAACSTTGGRLPPTEVIRYHLGGGELRAWRMLAGVQPRR